MQKEHRSYLARKEGRASKVEKNMFKGPAHREVKERPVSPGQEKQD